MLIWVSDSTARKKRCALGSTRKGRSPLRSGQRSLRGQPLRKYITIRCSDPNHCDTGAGRLPPAASMHQNRTTLADSVRVQSGIISAGFGVGSDDRSPNSALFGYCNRECLHKKHVMEPQKRKWVSARCRGGLRFSVRDWTAGLSFPKGSFGAEFVP